MTVNAPESLLCLLSRLSKFWALPCLLSCLSKFLSPVLVSILLLTGSAQVLSDLIPVPLKAGKPKHTHSLTAPVQKAAVEMLWHSGND
jgi:hypothetical protein